MSPLLNKSCFNVKCFSCQVEFDQRGLCGREKVFGMCYSRHLWHLCSATDDDDDDEVNWGSDRQQQNFSNGNGKSETSNENIWVLKGQDNPKSCPVGEIRVPGEMPPPNSDEICSCPFRNSITLYWCFRLQTLQHSVSNAAVKLDRFHERDIIFTLRSDNKFITMDGFSTPKLSWTVGGRALTPRVQWRNWNIGTTGENIESIETKSFETIGLSENHHSHEASATVLVFLPWAERDSREKFDNEEQCWRNLKQPHGWRIRHRWWRRMKTSAEVFVLEFGFKPFWLEPFCFLCIWVFVPDRNSSDFPMYWRCGSDNYISSNAPQQPTARVIVMANTKGGRDVW